MIIGSSALSPQESLSRLLALPRGATVLALGAADTGKTTWMRETALALNGAGRAVALADCDLGQGEIGPPGTIGVALAAPSSAWRALRDLPPLALYFVGATSPARHALDLCVGACQMTRAAKKHRPDLILVDTDGLIAGSAARVWKRRLAELLLPQAILGFARGEELQPLLAGFGHLDTPEIWQVEVGERVARKTAAARATRRAARFLAAFEGAQPMTLPWDEVALLGTSLGFGVATPHHLLKFIGESLDVTALHASQLPGGMLYVVVQGERWNSAGLAALESYFRTRAVVVASAAKFGNLLVGLIGSAGQLLGIGSVESVDFAGRALTVQTACRKPRAVAQVWMGGLRVRADGSELGEVRPGEI